MERRGKIRNICSARNKVWVKKGSDESDEDYMVSEEDGLDESDSEKNSFGSEDETEESLGEFEDDSELEEDLGKKNIKKVSRRRGGNSYGIANPRKKKFAYSEEQNLNDDNLGANRRKKSRSSQDVEEDGGRNRVSRQAAAQVAKGRKRKRNPKVVERTMSKKPGTQQVIRRRISPDPGEEFRDQNPVSRNKERIIKQVKGRRNKSSAISDSNFLSSGSSCLEVYTISEEERQQVREATEFRRMLTSSLRNNHVLEVTSEEEVIPSQRKLPGKKGKEKLEDVTIEVAKQVCGICLSEEGKRTVRGMLNCCSHYFCFACIMEWSKVESRCPLCKQRFATISRTAWGDGKFDLRDAVPVPERDQVYQPSEEELRGYLDPYGNVLCTECQEGGDDALMLLCDLCDSPAHTYCVGLGHEVPEGNWYCDGCRPTILGSSNAQAMNPTSDHGAEYNFAAVSSPGDAVQEPFNLNELHLPDTSLTQVTGLSSSLSHSMGDFQAASRSSGSVAYTLYERRRIQQQIHQLLNYRRHSNMSDIAVQVSGSDLFGSQIGQGLMAPQQTVTSASIEQRNAHHQGRLPTNRSNPLFNSREVLSLRLSNLRGQLLENEASASSYHSLNGLPSNECIGINLMIGRGSNNQQFHPCSSWPARGPDSSLSSCQISGKSHTPREKQRVQTLVKRHLKSLSRDTEIGYRSFKDIARTSTHTILAAVGLEYRLNEVYPIHTRPLSCDHFESGHTCPIRGQCSSCFDWFVRNVVREIIYTRFPVMPMHKVRIFTPD